MIDFLEGTVAQNAHTHVVVDVHGVGFLVHIPLSSHEPARAPGDPIRLLTYLHVREDAMMLFGFTTEPERQAFRLLISVSGIGPPMAQKILSGVPIREFTTLVSSGDAKGLTRIKGIGQKTAQRLVLELKDRVAEIGGEAGVAPTTGGDVRADEATSALIGLGANPAHARKVVEKAVEQNGAATVEELIRDALRAI